LRLHWRRDLVGAIVVRYQVDVKPAR
jgi:hypothetical protein